MKRLSIWVVIIGLLQPLSSRAEGLPSSEQFDAALRTCAAGGSIELQSNLVGSISSLYDGEMTKGALSFKTSADFLKLLPDQDRLEAYTLYTNCIMASVNLLNEKQSLNSEKIRSILVQKSEFDRIDGVLSEYFLGFHFIKFPQTFPPQCPTETAPYHPFCLVYFTRKFYGNEINPFLFSQYQRPELDVMSQFRDFLIDYEASGTYPAFTELNKRIANYNKTLSEFTLLAAKTYGDRSDMNTQLNLVAGAILNDASPVRELPKSHRLVRSALRDVQDSYCRFRDTFNAVYQPYKDLKKIRDTDENNACAVTIEPENTTNSSPDIFLKTFNL